MIGPTVALSFLESMSGTLVLGEREPERAALQAAGSPVNFKFSLLVEIPRLRAFLDAPSHVTTLPRGSVYWEGVAREGTPIMSGGTLQMYRDVTADGKVKDFRFLFAFTSDTGEVYTFDGQKLLANDTGFDMLEDLSRVAARLSRNGQVVAVGITSVHVDEFFEQLFSMQVHGASTLAESLEARGAFFTFMNAELKQVYPSLPALFHFDDRRYLRPSEWRALAFIAQAMLPDPLPPGGPTLDDVVLNVQSFVREASPSALDEIRSLLRFLGTFTPIVSPLAVRAALKHLMKPSATALLDVVDRLKLLAVVPYYAHPKADALLGYVRPTFQRTLTTRLPVSASLPMETFDLVIVGAGVAGALLAARATVRGQKVLLLEEGAYQHEFELSSDEIRMTARLYKASALQASTQSISVLQAACVGGGGVINNAICFQLPTARLARWQALGFPFSDKALRDAYARVAAELGIKPSSLATAHLNPAVRFLSSLGPVQVPRVDAPPPAGLSECLVNLEGCEGLGLCNTGCGSERKRNAFQVYLRRALATGRCTLVPNARVHGLLIDTTGAVSGADVEVDGVRSYARGREFILAAGAVASSAILLASDVLTHAPGLPIGRRFSANVGCPSYLFGKSVLHTRPSLQIAHAYLPEGDAGFVFESWFAPPGTAALTMPGYFETHAARMRAYRHATVIAPLVGVAPNGRIRLNASGRTVIDLPIGEKDFRTLLEGSATIARAAFASAPADLDHVVLGSRFGHEVRSENDVLAFLSGVASPAALRLATGHPQGGNALSTDGTISVLDEHFRVRGVRNLRVCDASVFPDVAGVNPQWTVMALADLLGAEL